MAGNCGVVVVMLFVGSLTDYFDIVKVYQLQSVKKLSYAFIHCLKIAKHTL